MAPKPLVTAIIYHLESPVLIFFSHLTQHVTCDSTLVIMHTSWTLSTLFTNSLLILLSRLSSLPRYERKWKLLWISAAGQAFIYASENRWFEREVKKPSLLHH